MLRHKSLPSVELQIPRLQVTGILLTRYEPENLPIQVISHLGPNTGEAVVGAAVVGAAVVGGCRGLFSPHHPSATFELIQFKKLVTLTYTPAYPGLAHPLPLDTTPISVYLPFSFTTKGPPLSP